MPSLDLSKTQRYIEWLKKKLFFDIKAPSASKRIVRRGEVYKCDLGMGIGSEESKERPCLILQYDAGNANSSNTIVAPITHSSSSLPIVVPIVNKYNSGVLILDGYVLLGNIVTVSKARLGDFIVTLEPFEMTKVDEAIAVSLDIKRHYDKLMNIHKDKLDYVEKLKKKITILESQKEEISNELTIFKDILDKHKIQSFQELDEIIQLRKPE